MRYHESVSSNRIQTCALYEEPLRSQELLGFRYFQTCYDNDVFERLVLPVGDNKSIWKGKIYTSFGTLDIEYQFFIRISLSLGKAEPYEGTKRLFFLYV